MLKWDLIGPPHPAEGNEVAFNKKQLTGEDRKKIKSLH